MQTAGYAVALALWPLVLATILASGKLAVFSTQIPRSEDKGFEGVSILMAVLGCCGALAVGAMLWALRVPTGWHARDSTLAIVLGVLALRSLVHIGAGLSGLRETSVDQTVARTGWYTTSSLCTTLLLVIAPLLFALVGAPIDLESLGFTLGMCALLLAWPLIIRRFFQDRQFTELLAGDRAALHRRAPDAGLTGLGWLLVGHAVLSASLAALYASGQESLFAHVLGTTSPSGFGERSLWWTVGLAIFEAWAGYELVRMSPQHRRIALGYGVVGVAVALYVAWPIAHALRALPPILALAASAPTVFQLVLPIATLLLASRSLTPTARARYRRRPPGQ